MTSTPMNTAICRKWAHALRTAAAFFDEADLYDIVTLSVEDELEILIRELAQSAALYKQRKN